jgi:hypothetical protein
MNFHFYNLFLCILLFSSCETYVHTVATPIIPTATEANDLVISGSSDLSGFACDAQYVNKHHFGMYGAIHGNKKRLESNSFVVPDPIHRASWQTTLGASYLLGHGARRVVCPIQIGGQYGGVRSFQLDRDLGTWRGQHHGMFLQLGVLFDYPSFQWYIGYQRTFVRYNQLTYIGTNIDPYRFATEHRISQFTWKWKNNYYMKFYGAINDLQLKSVNTNSNYTIFPEINFGFGFGCNLNKHNARYKIE